jgi:FKBP-type peptidyl-prolyl cis-trans isomerase SlyD
MVVSNSKVVSVSYELRLGETSGEVVESVGNDRPLSFIFGTGNMLPKFEENLNGFKVGDKFNFSLTADDAYGAVDQEAIVDLPIDIFKIDGSINEDVLFVGNRVPMRDTYGNQYNGIVLGIEAETVKIDFNHPLAGESLHFAGEVVEVREATEEELAHGHLHGNGGGCGCGSEGGGCCSSDDDDCCSSKEGGCGCDQNSCDC